ncbi:MAG: PhoH family protein [Ignavibacteria bacterium]|jgi:phosphate starvation-inducible PhoH-like protein|nr:PhoH family protein [Ignavibacteria bacterium]
MELIEKKIKINPNTDSLLLLGYNDSNISELEKRFGASIAVRGDTITIRGENNEIKMIERILDEFQYIIKTKGELTSDQVANIIEMADDTRAQHVHNDPSSLSTNSSDGIIYTGRKWNIVAKTPSQKEYWRQVQKNDIVFSIGPAGTGKTFLAVAMALAALKNNEVSRVVLSRPAVEAGESLGFLPGDLNEKVVPYLRPLLDALGDMLLPEKLKSMTEKGIIEIVPLAYMRGRTLNDSFIILDEAQNATSTQMKMFLTRLGKNSKAIVTGDITQTDLPRSTMSGLVHIQSILQGIDGIGFVYFDKSDVVRHRLVAAIIDAYEKAEAKAQKKDIESSK